MFKALWNYIRKILDYKMKLESVVGIL